MWKLSTIINDFSQDLIAILALALLYLWMLQSDAVVTTGVVARRPALPAALSQHSRRATVDAFHVAPHGLSL